MDETQLSAMTPPKPGSRRARRAAERAAAAAAAAAEAAKRSTATTGEIPAIRETPAIAPQTFALPRTRPVSLAPSIPFAEQMNHDLVIAQVDEDNAVVRKSRKATMMQGVGISSAVALVAGIGLGIAVDNVPKHMAMASGPSAAELAVASVSLGEHTPVIDGVTSHFMVSVDGKTRKINTSARASLADALTAAGIEINEADIVSAPLDKPIKAGAQVTITRVTTETVSETYDVEPETQREDDPTLPKGQEKKVSEGKAGQGTRTVVITKHDGKETSRAVSVDAITTPAEPTVIKVGTKDSAKSAVAVPVNAAPVAPGTARSIAADMVAARGWSEAEFACLDQLWQRESGWNHLANNPSSGAYGIPQALPGSKMASAGADWQTNPATQITWGLGYISGRYGTPCGALNHSHSVGWY
ncbi:G5 domain-containing protein [Arcanobacterium phocae]|uniref:aggregation-promoting factor C-terminal-like domain-containing protein n=1 Tax=Arcanobacterium phocae TaxID=131112 RepID=UPI001C0EABC0|nr:G5 domain-containing protein [Arcanobacterium phocae]